MIDKKNSGNHFFTKTSMYSKTNFMKWIFYDFQRYELVYEFVVCIIRLSKNGIKLIIPDVHIRNNYMPSKTNPVK